MGLGIRRVRFQGPQAGDGGGVRVRFEIGGMASECQHEMRWWIGSGVLVAFSINANLHPPGGGVEREGTPLHVILFDHYSLLQAE